MYYYIIIYIYYFYILYYLLLLLYYKIYSHIHIFSLHVYNWCIYLIYSILAVNDRCKQTVNKNGLVYIAHLRSFVCL